MKSAREHYRGFYVLMTLLRCMNSTRGLFSKSGKILGAYFIISFICKKKNASCNLDILQIYFFYLSSELGDFFCHYVFNSWSNYHHFITSTTPKYYFLFSAPLNYIELVDDQLFTLMFFIFFSV